MRGLIVILASAGALAFFLLGVWLGVDRQTPPAEPREGPNVAQVIDGSKLPLVALDGSPASSAFASGPVLVNFWATWCPPCLDELPLLNEVAHACPGKVAGVAIDDLEKARGMAQEIGIDFQSYATVPGLLGIDLMSKLGNRNSSMPYTILIDEHGRLSKSKNGDFKDVEEILDFIGPVCQT